MRNKIAQIQNLPSTIRVTSIMDFQWIHWKSLNSNEYLLPRLNLHHTCYSISGAQDNFYANFQWKLSANPKTNNRCLENRWCLCNSMFKKHHCVYAFEYIPDTSAVEISRLEIFRSTFAFVRNQLIFFGQMNSIRWENVHWMRIN